MSSHKWYVTDMDNRHPRGAHGGTAGNFKFWACRISNTVSQYVDTTSHNGATMSSPILPNKRNRHRNPGVEPLSQKLPYHRWMASHASSPEAENDAFNRWAIITYADQESARYFPRARRPRQSYGCRPRRQRQRGTGQAWGACRGLYGCPVR